MNINVWNGHVFSYFSVGGKTVYQIRVEGPNVLLEFQFDTDRYLFEDFDMSKLSKRFVKITESENGEERGLSFEYEMGGQKDRNWTVLRD